MKNMAKTTNKNPDMVNYENFGYYYYILLLYIIPYQVYYFLYKLFQKL